MGTIIWTLKSVEGQQDISKGPWLLPVTVFLFALSSAVKRGRRSDHISPALISLNPHRSFEGGAMEELVRGGQ
nr:hypothetical protein Itr_chr15CG05780 [Ipomoea trifida]